MKKEPYRPDRYRVPRLKTEWLIDRFESNGTARTISRAGLNGMAATGVKGALKLKTTWLIEGFEPVGIASRISRAGLNGMEAIERGRRAGGSAGPD